jgi:hypothetical protein
MHKVMKFKTEGFWVTLETFIGPATDMMWRGIEAVVILSTQV